MVKQSILAMGFVAAMATTGSAESVYGTIVTGGDLSSSRSGGGQIGYHGSLSGVNISWNIEYNSVSGLYHYDYTFDVGKKTNAVLLEFGPNAGADARAVSNLQGGGDAFGTTNFDPSLSSLYGITVGLAGGPQSFTLQFDSDRAPVWGNVYLDGQGDGNYAYNAGLATANHVSSDMNMFIASPGGGAVPEPSSIALLGCGAIGLMGVGLRRRKARGA